MSRAGGLCSQEVRRESDDAVRLEVESDPVALAVWERHKRHFRLTARRAETFADWLQENRWAYWDAQRDMMVLVVGETREEYEDRVGPCEYAQCPEASGWRLL